MSVPIDITDDTLASSLVPVQVCIPGTPCKIEVLHLFRWYTHTQAPVPPPRGTQAPLWRIRSDFPGAIRVFPVLFDRAIASLPCFSCHFHLLPDTELISTPGSAICRAILHHGEILDKRTFAPVADTTRFSRRHTIEELDTRSSHTLRTWPPFFSDWPVGLQESRVGHPI